MHCKIKHKTHNASKMWQDTLHRVATYSRYSGLDFGKLLMNVRFPGIQTYQV